MARFVLVHGAFGGAWCWDRVVPLLEAGGHAVQTLDLPGCGEDQTPLDEITLQSCAERVCDVLESDGEEAVLVGLSMGGVINTQAAALAPGSVDSLVFVAAFMPANGQSLLDLAEYPEGAGNQIKENMVVEGEPPVATLPLEATREAVYNCCTDEQFAYALERRCPQAVAPFATPVKVDDEALDSIPRSYVLTLQDNSLRPALQRRMISEHPCRRVVELDTDHAPYLSATAELAAALNELAL